MRRVNTGSSRFVFAIIVLMCATALSLTFALSDLNSAKAVALTSPTWTPIATQVIPVWTPLPTLAPAGPTATPPFALGEIRRLTGHTSGVRSVAFSADGRLILTGGNDGTARLWDAQTGAELRQFVKPSSNPIIRVAFSPDGRSVLISQRSELFDVQTGDSERPPFLLPLERFAFSPDGKYILFGNANAVGLVDITTGQQIRMFAPAKPYNGYSIRDVAYSPDGRYVLAGGENFAHLWDIQTGEEVRTFSVASNDMRTVAYSPDGRYILANDVKVAYMWDVATGREVYRLTGHTDALMSVSFSANGRCILTSSLDSTARLWDVGTGEELYSFIGHIGAVNAAIFSPDGRYVLTGGEDTTVRKWDVQSVMKSDFCG